MWRYAVRRLLLCVPTFFGITVVVFALIHMAPGDPASATAVTASGSAVSGETAAKLRERFHLDESVPRQYLAWVGGLLQLDLGRSFHDGRPVVAKIAERLPATMSLMTGALVVALLIAIPLGVECARRPGSRLDTVVGAACFGLNAVPRYVAAMVLILVVGVRLDLLPFMGISSDDAAAASTWARMLDVLRHSALIGTCVAYPMAAYFVRFVRANVLEALEQDFIRTARAKGVGEIRVAYVHALQNTLLGLLTVVGSYFPVALGGTVILEVMFSWPGMGRLMYESVLNRDYPVAMALCVCSAVVVMLTALVVDLLYAAVDPRVRYS